MSATGAGTVPGKVATLPSCSPSAKVAKLLKVSVVFVRREISAGTLPTVRLGRSVRVARTDLDAHIEARREGRWPQSSVSRSCPSSDWHGDACLHRTATHTAARVDLSGSRWRSVRSNESRGLTSERELSGFVNRGPGVRISPSAPSARSQVDSYRSCVAAGLAQPDPSLR
jgi:excisionase family DNA binding protein